MKFFSWLTHPRLIPIYTFALFVEIERQSYTINIVVVLYTLGYVLLNTFLIDKIINQNKTSPLINSETSLFKKISHAVWLTALYTLITIIFVKHRTFNNIGSEYIFSIYILPLWLNIFSGKTLNNIFKNYNYQYPTQYNIAPTAFIGGFSGYSIVIGYKTGVDTFWPFTISLLLLSISIKYNHENAKLSHQLCNYILGIGCAILIMSIF